MAGVRVFLMIILMFAFSACGSSYEVKNFDDHETTGAKNKDDIPFTSASPADTFDLDNLKRTVDGKSKSNLLLADSIESISLERNDATGNVVATKPTILKVGLKLRGGNSVLHYVAHLIDGAANLVTTADDAQTLRLNLKCLDADCASVEVHVQSPIASSGFIYRTRHVTIEALGPFAPSGKPTRLTKIGSLAGAAADPILNTVEIAWGPSTFELQAGDLHASGELVATGGDQETIAVVVKNEAPIDGRLIGNSNHGDLLLRFSDADAWSFVRIRLPVAVTAPIAGPAEVDTTPVNERYIPFDLSSPTTASFQRDKANPIVVDAITEFSKGKRAGDLKNFLNRMYPNRAIVVDALKSQGVPPEFAFIMLIESNYFVSPGFPISISAPGAVGPWQFMPDTARTYGLSPLPIKKVPSLAHGGKSGLVLRADPCDLRTDLSASTIAAGRYFKKLLTMFRNDPKLAVMAYNLGENGLNRRLNCINAQRTGAACSGSSKPLEISDFAGLDYWTVRDLNVAPRESINYVPRFLGAQFVGREPSRYGITVSTSGFPMVPASSCRK